MNRNKKAVSSIFLLVASILWGFSFVVQSIGGKTLGAYTFNSFRLLIGALALFIAIHITDKAGVSRKPHTAAEKKLQLTTGLLCGVFICIATNLQQVALNLGASAGKAGFLTAMYIILVPLIGIFFRQKCGWNVWVAVVIAVAGLYFLCITGSFSLSLPDLLLIGCALGFAIQIMIIDRRGDRVDSLRLSGMQFLTAGILTLIPALIFEIIPYSGGFSSWLALWSSSGLWLQLMYMGIMSCGVAYTFQIIGQKGLKPAIAALIMSLESVFSVISGWLVLGEKLSLRELLGCALIFFAVILAQISFKSVVPVREKERSGASPVREKD